MNEQRRSGRQARQAERAQKGGGMGRPYITRNIPTYDVLSEENLLRIEAAADSIAAAPSRLMRSSGSSPSGRKAKRSDWPGFSRGSARSIAR